MPKYSAKARKIQGKGKRSGPGFMQLPHYVKRSTGYHGLSLAARALLTEIYDRYNGSNNGMIALGVREAAYELGCNQGTISRAARELDDADLVRPTKVGAWRGREATEWRVTWRRCDKTGDLPRSNWVEPDTLPSTCPPQAQARASNRYRTCEALPCPPASRKPSR